MQSVLKKCKKKLMQCYCFKWREEKTKKKGRAEAEHGADREYNFVIEG